MYNMTFSHKNFKVQLLIVLELLRTSQNVMSAFVGDLNIVTVHNNSKLSRAKITLNMHYNISENDMSKAQQLTETF